MPQGESRSPLLANVLHNRAMDFVLTDHVEREAQRRQVPMDWIESTMTRPEQVIS